MILRDTLEVLQGATPTVVKTLPAQVGHSRTGEGWEKPGRDYVMITTEELRAIIPPYAGAVDNARYLWRGDTYKQVGPAKVRRKAGRDHHYTIVLEAAA